MFQVYDVRELQRQLGLRRAQTIGIFAAGALFGLICSQPGSARSVGIAPVAQAQAVSCDGRAMLKLDCKLPSF